MLNKCLVRSRIQMVMIRFALLQHFTITHWSSLRYKSLWMWGRFWNNTVPCKRCHHTIFATSVRTLEKRSCLKWNGILPQNSGARRSRRDWLRTTYRHYFLLSKKLLLHLRNILPWGMRTMKNVSSLTVRRGINVCEGCNLRGLCTLTILDKINWRSHTEEM